MKKSHEAEEIIRIWPDFKSSEVKSEAIVFLVDQG